VNFPLSKNTVALPNDAHFFVWIASGCIRQTYSGDCSIVEALYFIDDQIIRVYIREIP